MEIDTKIKLGDWNEEMFMQHFEKLGIAIVNNTSNPKQMENVRELEKQMDEGKNILVGTVAWNDVDSEMNVFTSFGWIKYINGEGAKETHERAAKAYLAEHLEPGWVPAPEDNPSRRYPTFKSQLGPEELEKFQVFEDGLKV